LQVVNAQNYVLYFESDIAKVFPFRPTATVICQKYWEMLKHPYMINQNHIFSKKYFSMIVHF
jgi:hypothetical protein